MANGNVNGNGTREPFWPTWKSNKLFTLVLTILFTYLIVWLGSMIWLNTLKVERVGRADVAEHTIVIDGTGKVTGTPDIAVASLGLQVIKPDVPSAQRENTEKMNAFINQLKANGIAADDIQTADYSIYPQYRYDSGTGRSEIDGYTVSQSVTVKIRDLTKISMVLAKAGEGGLNQVSGISFTIDDPETLRAEARAEAVVQVKDKLAALEQQLGVNTVRIVGFSESPGSVVSPYASRYFGAEGGGGMGVAPQVESGSLDIVVSVSVTYEIR